MSRKSKGINAERELVHLFQSNGWSAVRIAGSGSSKYPSPDVLASNALRRLAIECKTLKEGKKYFSEEDIGQLKEFATKFGTESWIGIKFGGMPWYFLSLEDLEKTGKNMAISVDLAQKKGLKFENLIGK
ncbi:Holliday junction resolvase [Candidatus Woesearchaeota archaeon]|nr:Holliday junction resolvase [Candidatus Woesearchaeota archaeon]